MVVYFHAYFTNCNFLDIGLYTLRRCDPIHYEVPISQGVQPSDIGGETIGLDRVWDDYEGYYDDDYDEF